MHPLPFRDRSLWSLYSQYYRGHSRLVAFCLGGSLVRSLLSVPIALLVREAIDGGFTNGTPRSLVMIAAAMVGVYLFSATLSIAIQRSSARVNSEATVRLRTELVRRLHELPRSFITSQEAAEMQSIIVSDTNRVSDISGSMINSVIPSAITGVALIGYLLFLSPWLGAVVLIAGPVSALLNHLTRESVDARAREFRLAMQRFNGSIHRAVRIWDLTSAQNAVDEEVDRCESRIDDVSTTQQRLQRTQNVYAQTQSLTVSMAGVVVLVLGGIQVQNRSITIGTFLSFFVVMAMAQGAVQSLLGSLPTMLIGREALLSLQEWYDAATEPPYQGTHLPPQGGNITFDNVSFAYGEQAVLDGVNLEIPAGRTVALLGPNGAGKTTLMHLLMGWYRPAHGRLLVDGVPFDQLSMRAWRSQIALVHQDPTFLSGTVRENIVYGRPETTDAELWDAARLAAADDMIRGLPLGLETQIGEGGVRLSGGQRQRMALTRALVRQPLVLILDEPTNHLDRPAVQRLLEQLGRLPQQPTIIVITHDRDVLGIADQTFRIDGGRLVQLAAVSAAS